MIAVSQTLALGIPVATAGAGGMLAENTSSVENGFLEALAATDTAAGVSLAPDRVADGQTAGTGSTDESSVDAMLEAASVPSAIWQPFLQATSAPLPLKPVSVPPDIAAKQPPPAPGTASVAAAPSVPGPSGDAPPAPARPTADQPRPDIMPQADASPNQDQVLPAPTPIQGAKNPSAHPAPLPAPVSSAPAAPEGDEVRAAQPGPADPAIGQGHPLQGGKDPQSGGQLPADAAKAVPTASAVENAWRQKWLGAGETAPDDSPGVSTLAVAPSKADGADQATPPTGWVLSPIAAGQTTQSLARAAPTADGGSPEMMRATGTIAPVIKTGPEAAQAEPSSAAQHSFDQPAAGMSADLRSLDVTGFGVPAATGPASPDAASGSSPVAPAASTPAVITPTIIDMAKTGNDGPVELTLSPEELGRLTISLKRDGDFVHVTMTADRPETLDLMRRHASDLIADLRQAGFSGASLHFGQGGKDHRAQAPEGVQDANTASSTLASPPETSLPIPDRSGTGSGVDLRF